MAVRTGCVDECGRRFVFSVASIRTSGTYPRSTYLLCAALPNSGAAGPSGSPLAPSIGGSALDANLYLRVRVQTRVPVEQAQTVLGRPGILPSLPPSRLVSICRAVCCHRNHNAAKPTVRPARPARPALPCPPARRSPRIRLGPADASADTSLLAGPRSCQSPPAQTTNQRPRRRCVATL